MSGSRGVVRPFLPGRALLTKLCGEAFMKTSQNHKYAQGLKVEGTKPLLGAGDSVGVCGVGEWLLVVLDQSVVGAWVRSQLKPRASAYSSDYLKNPINPENRAKQSHLLCNELLSFSLSPNSTVSAYKRNGNYH